MAPHPPAHPHPTQSDKGIEAFKSSPNSTTSDSISSLCAADSVLMVGRSSGVVHRYSLPHLTLEGTHVLRCRPHMMALNCNLSKMSIIDINGVLSFFDLLAKVGGLGGGVSGKIGDVWEHLSARCRGVGACVCLLHLIPHPLHLHPARHTSLPAPPPS